MTHYRLDGHNPVAVDDALEWAQWFEHSDDERRVAFDAVGDVEISTVFLGLDHQWGNGPPLIFETMVFNGPLDQEQDRYSTWEEAEAGHKAMVERVRASQAEGEKP